MVDFSKYKAILSKDNDAKNRVGMLGLTIGEIDKKLDEKINERLLKLLKIGLTHELTLDNLKRYIRSHKKKTKLYKLADYFSEANLIDIEKMLKYLYSTGIIGRDSNNWYYWKEK